MYGNARRTRPIPGKSLPDTKVREDAVEHVLGCGFPRDLAKGRQGLAQIYAQELGRGPENSPSKRASPSRARRRLSRWCTRVSML